ncbi:hypothetical protein EMIHUDRAFT_220325 [Emiliania huxleyi CCMP1516]|uniref:Rhodanese domain-containing protein n=2 Tax=Emiliania huxleyi TaxID=2903 RepID=A0A0D3I1Q7_EMIH1|nr:hypothetical protein EMIHUDRAFT_220325 [Emiliania huxleyi CCMP1516]EOD05192.1 hypothetical protein EMIHUDRAFT_220325 [Emiliania huxleyi CCMP1516]|eukprot:XP_005757621.1 hypothetical protein EMIHUDRAFT_220325 [Emiliania huxleyi CCMP1516]
MLLAASLFATTHVVLQSPTPRTDNDYLYTFDGSCDGAQCDSFCGDAVGTGPVTTLTPGPLTVRWGVAQSHPPYKFRISLNRVPLTDDNFDDPANLLGVHIGTQEYAYDTSHEVIIPETPACEHQPCTLQLYDLYYFVSCANVRIITPSTVWTERLCCVFTWVELAAVSASHMTNYDSSTIAYSGTFQQIAAAAYRDICNMPMGERAASASARLVVGEESSRYWSGVRSSPDSRLEVAVGTSLEFRYNYAHDLWLLPGEKAYRECDFSAATQLAGLGQGGGQGTWPNLYEAPLCLWCKPLGDAVVDRPGVLLLACSVGISRSHCGQGQRIRVVVVPKNADGYVTIGPAELKAKLDAGAFGAVVDVRRREEWDAGHIAGATLLASFNTAGFSAAGAEQLEGCKRCAVAVYCNSGRRSKEAAGVLVSAGFTEVYDGLGIVQWLEDGSGLGGSSGERGCVVRMFA